ncbi:MAG: hypothetical protein KJO63_12485 [Maribacter sp.]|nr:hypothetical protein [Maribacter sp.]
MDIFSEWAEWGLGIGITFGVPSNSHTANATFNPIRMGIIKTKIPFKPA